MTPQWQLEPDSATSVIASVASTPMPSARFTSALADLSAAMSPSETVRHAAETFDTRHRDVPDRLAQRIQDITDAGAAVIAAIGTGDDLMATEIRLAAAATTAYSAIPPVNRR